MIHLFILPGDNPENSDAKRAILSVPLVSKVSFLSNRKMVNNEVLNPFYMFLYDNEFLSKELWLAIPTILNQNYHFVRFYHRKWDTGMYSVSPRLFKQDVELNEDLTVKSFKFLLGETLLDGFIEAE